MIEINAIGGFYKTFEVQVDPNRMAALRVSLDEIIKALERNNANTGGGYIVHEGEQRFIRGEAMLHGIDDIEKVVIRSGPATCRFSSAMWPRSSSLRSPVKALPLATAAAKSSLPSS